MNDWIAQLKADPLPWLLEPDEANPGVRYFALRDLLDRSADDPEVVAARGEVMRTGPVPAILESLAVDIAIYRIAARRNRESDSVRRRYEDAVKFLKDVAAGKAVIAGVTAASGSGSRDHAKIEGDTRIFTRDKMKGF